MRIELDDFFVRSVTAGTEDSQYARGFVDRSYPCRRSRELAETTQR